MLVLGIANTSINHRKTAVFPCHLGLLKHGLWKIQLLGADFSAVSGKSMGINGLCCEGLRRIQSLPMSKSNMILIINNNIIKIIIYSSSSLSSTTCSSSSWSSITVMPQNNHVINPSITTWNHQTRAWSKAAPSTTELIAPRRKKGINILPGPGFYDSSLHFRQKKECPIYSDPFFFGYTPEN